jgi:hypothetical protein
MSYSLSEAAAAVGMYKSSVLRAIKGGKISATKDEHGEWRIEVAELHRVYPPVASNGADAPDGAALALRAEVAEQRLADLKTALEDMRTERDARREQAQRLSLPKPTEQRAWWRRRLVG